MVIEVQKYNERSCMELEVFMQNNERSYMQVEVFIQKNK